LGPAPVGEPGAPPPSPARDGRERRADSATSRRRTLSFRRPVEGDASASADPTDRRAREGVMGPPLERGKTTELGPDVVPEERPPVAPPPLDSIAPPAGAPTPGRLAISEAARVGAAGAPSPAATPDRLDGATDAERGTMPTPPGRAPTPAPAAVGVTVAAAAAAEGGVGTG